ncbi:MAG: hypothetical protein ACFFCV_18790 [Promethearchaeota archaeon]
MAEGKINKEAYPRSRFESPEIMAPFIKKFGKKDTDDLKNEILKIERQLRLICYDFPRFNEENLDFLRKFVLLLKLLNRIIERSLNSKTFTFSWEDIISNLLFLENDPNLMINSMIREIKRRNSYNAMMLARKKSKKNYNMYKNQFQQKRITEFIFI